MNRSTNTNQHPDDSKFLAFITAATALWVGSIVLISQVVSDKPDLHWWNIAVLVVVVFVAPGLASFFLCEWLLGLVGQRAFERTVWAMSALGLFTSGLFEQRFGVRLFDLVAGPFFISIQTLFPDWTLSGTIDSATRRFYRRFPRLAWLETEDFHSGSSETIAKRYAAAGVGIAAGACVVAVPIGIINLGMPALLIALLGLALFALSLMLALAANDEVQPEGVMFPPPDPDFMDYNDTRLN